MVGIIEQPGILRPNTGLNCCIEVGLCEGAAFCDEDVVERLRRGDGNLIWANSDNGSVFFVEFLYDVESITFQGS